MYNLTTLLCAFVLLFSVQYVSSQSFEEMNIPDVTTTLSASRSANFIDVNGDGWDDIFFSNGPYDSQDNMLYINEKDGGFDTITTDDIVSDNSRSDGTSFADVDNDGDLDAYVVTYGFGGSGNPNLFYRNDGEGSFTYEPDNALGLVNSYSEMGTWVDINNDQYLDMYFTNSYLNLHNSYFENQGDGSFLEINDLSITNDNLATRSVDWIDYDGDGDSDLFLTNENNAKNSLFRNDGPNNFVQIDNLSIVQGFNNSAGSSWADVDNDGDFDLFVANWEGQDNQLFINNNGVFSEQVNSIIASGGGSSFGSSFGDMDNDGDLDLFVCNAYFTGQTKNFVYINDGQGNFSQDTSSDLANHTGNTFGCAFGDYDHDGWLDIILANTFSENQANSLFHNTGEGNNWVKLICKGTTSNFSAVGAKVRVRSTISGEEVWQTRKITASSGYCSQNSYTVHVGLGDASNIDEIEILWPSGLTENFNDIAINEMYIIIEEGGITLNSGNAVKQEKIRTYPNPVQSNFMLEGELSNSNSEVSLSIFNLQGKEVKRIKSIFLNGKYVKELIDISNLNSGIYLFAMKNGKKLLHTGKIIKE